MKWWVALAFLGIVASLGSALFFMMRKPTDAPRVNAEQQAQQHRAQAQNMVRALALRVGVSIVLFLCILLAWKLGYIQPTGLPVNAG